LTLSVSDSSHQIKSYTEKLSIESSGRIVKNCKINIPKKTGYYKMEAKIIFKKDTITSTRKFKVV